MKHIVITRGVFGYVAAPGAPVVAKVPGDPPFAVEDKLADRLVASDVAEYAEPVGAAGSEQDPPAAGAEYSEGMTRDQLNEIAKSYGVEAPDKIRGGKSAVIKAIEEAKAKGGEDDNGGTNEQPPAPGLADPV